MGLAATAAAHFEQLRASGASPAVSDWIRRAATEGEDEDGFQINPFRVAAEVGVEPLVATRSFLIATRLGVTDLTWNIHCPSCLAVPDYHGRLMELPSRAHCALCTVRWDLSFEDQVEVTFTLNPNVRPIDVGQFAEREWPRDRATMFRRFEREGRVPVGMQFVPHGTAERTVTLPAGEYSYSVPGDLEGAGVLWLEGEPAAATQRFELTAMENGKLDVLKMRLRPGPVCIVVHDRTGRDSWGMHLRPVGPPKNWVSAAFVTSLQDFRDLFASEYLAPDRSFAIRSTTLLFTDITGSTEMYEKLGDARAFALVQQHFELMTGIIRKRAGGIVKTIGDAVMASFPKTVDALMAALEIQDGFAAVAEPLSQITVKIGLHRGPTIAVTSNRMLDYFGRTVNVAARVQGASKSREVLVSEAVLRDPAVEALWREGAIVTEQRSAALKGIEGVVTVHSVRRGGRSAAAGELTSPASSSPG